MGNVECELVTRRTWLAAIATLPLALGFKPAPKRVSSLKWKRGDMNFGCYWRAELPGKRVGVVSIQHSEGLYRAAVIGNRPGGLTASHKITSSLGQAMRWVESA